MKAWEYVIHTAMLGTDKPAPDNSGLPAEVAEIAAAIDALEPLDKEANFLQKAAVIYNYRQCGFVPFQQKDLPAIPAPIEIQSYCSEEAAMVLSDILQQDNNALLELWLRLCNDKGELLLPDFLPAVLDAAVKDKYLQPLVLACGGNRGLWLSQLNPSWGYFNVASDEELWQTGKPEQRYNVLKRLRQTDSQQAREWLQQTWIQETSASKVEFLKILRINISVADLEWLETLLSEKGQKVKDEALTLLKLIPGSSVLNLYQELLEKSIILKKERALLGMMKKISIQQILPDIVDDAIFKSGIGKLAGLKSVFTDEGFILYQLIRAVPPSFWEKQFDATPAQVFDYFDKYAHDKVPALGQAVSHFKQKEWIPYFLDHPELYPGFLEMMTKGEQEKYLARFLKTDAGNTINYAIDLAAEWGTEFGMMLLREMANHPYEYHRAFFNKHIRLIPAGIINQLDKIEPKDPNMQNVWGKAKDHLIKLLGLKQRTLKAFNV